MIRGWGDLMMGGSGGGGGSRMMGGSEHFFNHNGVGGGRRFEEQYHCYSVAYADKAHLEIGDKILLPPSAFDTLARLQVDYPMLFRLSVPAAGGSGGGGATSTGEHGEERRTHCGVLEFTAEEGCCYIPFWMMQNLLIEEGTLVTVTNVSLPKATFVKLQPQSVDFLEISNPRAVLEHALRNFSCVTLNDIIQIPYNNKNYHFALKEVNPSPAACIIETDCNVDFDAPVGYQEPERVFPPPPPSTTSNNTTGANSVRSSACPSPATTATSLTTGGGGDMMMNNGNNMLTDDDDDGKSPPRTRIVNGQIIRPEDYMDDAMSRQSNAASSTTANSSRSDLLTSTFLAPRTGATGIQRNAAIPENAPEVDYWALQAGDGSRLDGKQPTPLKDKTGNVVDIRKVRAEAAQNRVIEHALHVAEKLPTFGRTVGGETIPDANHITTTGTGSGSGSILSPPGVPPAAPPITKRTKRIGSKYSTLKASTAAFGGK